VPDHWVSFTDKYLDALDDVGARSAAKTTSRRRAADQGRKRRSDDLAEWHLTLLDRLFGNDAEDRLDRLATHPALGGPDLIYFRTQLSRRRGDLAAARRLVGDALDRLPGHRDYLALAKEIDAAPGSSAGGGPVSDRSTDGQRLTGSQAPQAAAPCKASVALICTLELPAMRPSGP
jgi:hypothetical protein